MDFIPTAGHLGQLIVETTADNTPHLGFSIEIDFAEGEFDGETGTPFLRISNLRLPEGKSWRSLANQSWDAASPNNPANVDAVILLFGMPNPVEVQSLQLGEVQPDGSVPATMNLIADFESEAYRDSLDAVPIALELVTLKLEPLRLSTRLEKQLRGEEAATREAVAPIVALDDYGPLERIPGGFGFPPKFS
ncbi:MAG: hypothetical protein AAF591_05180 [Verrucomicrobiota bacterium]